MTVGRHRPAYLPHGSRPAQCDICGSVWYSHELTRKRDGLQYCPQDVRGADSVTLAEANARDAASAGRRSASEENQGSPDNSGAEIREMPTGILVDNVAGWWGYRNVERAGGLKTVYNFPYVTSRDNPGNLQQPDNSKRPAFDGDNDITFDGSDDYLLSPYRPLVAQGAYPSLWAVGSFDDPSSATARSMFALTDVGLTMGYTAAAVNKVYLQVQSNTITLGFTVFIGPSTTTHMTASYVFTSTALHLWTVVLEASRIVLYEDGVEVAATTLANITSKAYTNMFMGAGVTGTTRGAATTIVSHDGKCNELVVSKTTVSTDEHTSMKDYFRRNFTELTIT